MLSTQPKAKTRRKAGPKTLVFITLWLAVLGGALYLIAAYGHV